MSHSCPQVAEVVKQCKMSLCPTSSPSPPMQDNKAPCPQPSPPFPQATKSSSCSSSVSITINSDSESSPSDNEENSPHLCPKPKTKPSRNYPPASQASAPAGNQITHNPPPTAPTPALPPPLPPALLPPPTFRPPSYGSLPAPAPRCKHSPAPVPPPSTAPAIADTSSSNRSHGWINRFRSALARRAIASAFPVIQTLLSPTSDDEGDDASPSSSIPQRRHIPFSLKDLKELKAAAATYGPTLPSLLL
nr:uncharacterized protein LOC105746938 [Dasypus novemcinctus]